MGKESKCKCGHMREPDHQKESSFLRMKTKELTNCSKCCCNGFIEENYPTRMDKISTGVAIGALSFIVLIIIGFGFISHERYSELLMNDPDNLLKKTLITYSGMFKILPVVLILLGSWFVFNIMGIVSSYRKSVNHKKPTKPVLVFDDIANGIKNLAPEDKNKIRDLLEKKDEG